MFAVSCISTMNVRLAAREVVRRTDAAKIRSTMPSSASRAGTNEPACASSAISAI